MTTEILLHQDLFARDRRLLLTHGEIAVHAFRFDSGVAALDVDTGCARFVLLPFQGQQIWDAWVGNRRLTMQSVFDIPLPTREFRRGYGAFFVHCGGTAMGSPQAGETHMPHGELPNIAFDRASLVLGQEEGRVFVALTGIAHDREAFSHAYAFRPRLRFVAGRADVTSHVEIENFGGSAMPVMYLGHVNFRPVAGGQIRDALEGRAGITWQRPSLAPDAPGVVQRWHESVTANFERHRQIGADDRVEPEFVFTAKFPGDADGWAHALQVLPDGSADYVSYRPETLPFGVRWLTRAPERQALGVVLPATAGPEGRAAAKAAGHLNVLAPGEVFAASMRFGATSPEEAGRLLRRL